VRDSPRDVQRVKGHGQGNVPSSLTRRAPCSRETRLATLNDLLSAVCSIEEYFARSQNSEPRKKTGKTKLNYLPGPWGNEKSALRIVKMATIDSLENSTGVPPTCYVSTHAVFSRNGSQMLKYRKLLQQNDLQ